jgi:multiple sugar transport system ATP-binding protein
MSDAEVQQVGTPAEVYYDPSNLFVARFIGSPGMNLAHGQYRDGAINFSAESKYVPPDSWLNALNADLPDTGEVIAGYRPEAAEINDTGQLAGEVYASELYGAYTMLHVKLNEEDIVHIRSDRLVRHPIGTTVHFDLDPEMVRFFNPNTEMAILQR